MRFTLTGWSAGGNKIVHPTKKHLWMMGKAIEESDLSMEKTYMGSIPPVQINAMDCGEETIRIIYEERVPDRLRRWAERMERDTLLSTTT